MNTPIACVSCGTRFEPTDIDSELKLASCQSCGELFDLSQPALVKADPDIPDRFTVSDTASSLIISRRWRTDAIWLVFGALLLSTLLTFISVGLTVALQKLPLQMNPFGFALVTVALLWAWLAGCFNATHITVDETSLTVGYGPIPVPFLPRSRSWPRRTLTGLLVIERPLFENGARRIRSLFAEFENGTRHSLAGPFAGPRHSRWLEQALVRRLGVTVRR